MGFIDYCRDSGWGPEITGPIILALVIVLLIVYILDINYYLRAGLVLFKAFFVRKKLGFLDSSIVFGTVLPFDSDLQITHMNNARVLREYDFGRMDYWARTGLLDKYVIDTISLKTSQVLAVANVIRYRRPMHMFMKYKIVTRAMHWDDKILYLEQRMVTVNDEITRNMGYLKVKFAYNIDEFVRTKHPGVVKPEIPKDLEIWMKFNDANGLKTKVCTLNNQNEDEGGDE